MSSKRDLKRVIGYVCTELFAECVAASLHNGTSTKEDSKAICTSILNLHSDFIKRIGHPEPGLPAKKYYRFTIDEFNKQLEEIVDQITNLY